MYPLGVNPQQPQGTLGVHLKHALEYSLKLDGCLLQIVDVKEPAEKDIQARSKHKASLFVNQSMS